MTRKILTTTALHYTKTRRNVTQRSKEADSISSSSSSSSRYPFLAPSDYENRRIGYITLMVQSNQEDDVYDRLRSFTNLTFQDNLLVVHYSSTVVYTVRL